MCLVFLRSCFSILFTSGRLGASAGQIFVNDREAPPVPSLVQNLQGQVGLWPYLSLSVGLISLASHLAALPSDGLDTPPGVPPGEIGDSTVCCAPSLQLTWPHDEDGPLRSLYGRVALVVSWR